LVPELLVRPLAPRLEQLGFAHVIELPHGETVRLRRGLRATCYSNVNHSILVLEDGDCVHVNVNDALFGTSPAIIDHFCQLIRQRHGRVDVLFLGYAGASTWPSNLREPGKDIRRQTREREALFARNSLRVIEQLQPRMACAFGGSFAVLEQPHRWVNDVRFETPTPDVLFPQQHPTSRTQVHLLLPNDVVNGLDLVEGTAPRPSAVELDRATEGPLREAHDQATHLPLLSPDALRSLLARLDVQVRWSFPRARSQAPFDVELRLREKPETALTIRVTRTGAQAMLGAATNPVASIVLRAEVLESVLRDEDGIDAILTACGAVITLHKPEAHHCVEAVLRLLTPRPGPWQTLLEQLNTDPRRTLRMMWGQKWPLLLAATRRLHMFSLAAEPLPVAPSVESSSRKAA